MRHVLGRGSLWREEGGREAWEAFFDPCNFSVRMRMARASLPPGAQFNSFVKISTDFSTDFSTEFLVLLPSAMAECRPDMEKLEEWPARGRAAVSPFPCDILPSRTVQGVPHYYKNSVENSVEISTRLLN